jgi:acyl-CoA synthetase (AMP-forming)/AMP-acid ligase II
MHTLLLLDMAASGHGDRVAARDGDAQLSYEQLQRAAWAAVSAFEDARHVAYVGANGLAYPIGLFGAAAAGVPFIPLNYRLPDEQIDNLLRHHDDVVVVADEGIDDRLRDLGHRVIGQRDFVNASLPGTDPGEAAPDGEDVALLLYTSGTTAAPKAAVLRHRHLASYVIGSVEFGAAEDSDAALVCVPPYHVAGVANLLSNTYLGRRIVYLDRFDPILWLETVRREEITHAMVVPTMLARLTDALAGQTDAATPTLRSLSYGGSRTPATVLERIMELFPTTDLTNAYGLTETSSTIAVLGPDDHRAAAASDDPLVRGRLSSAGRVLPTVEVDLRDNGRSVELGEVGDIWVRGEQVAGEYEGIPRSVDADGWFPTRDRGWLDADGYLFIEGRSDDTIIRGGENIAPAEIEEVLLGHPDVARCAVVGVPDDVWGQRIAAVVVLRDGAHADVDALTSFARNELRGSKTPDIVSFATDLPYTETGKLLRRQVLADLMADQRENRGTG